jgi:hypothetical protein
MTSGKLANKNLQSIFCGPIKITPLSQSEEKEFVTIGGKTANCNLFNYQLTDFFGTDLKIAYCIPAVDNRDIRGMKDLSTHTKVRILGGGSRRLGMYPFDESKYYVVLKQVRPSKRGSSVKPSLQIATIDQLQEGSGIDVRSELNSSGASDIDTKEALLNDDLKDGSILCVTFPKENKEIPIKAYIITRVFPLLNNYQG